MKNTIIMITIAIMTILGVEISRLDVSADELVATTVETVADNDINSDGEVNEKDVEAIVMDLIYNPNTTYCVADWVRVYKIVESKLGPAICSYDMSRMDVNAQNADIVNKLIASENLKVEMKNDGIKFTRSEEMLTEFFKFDNCETNPSDDIYYIGSFTATSEIGDVLVFEVGIKEKHYILLKGVSNPIENDPIESDTTPKYSTKIVIRANSSSEKLDMMEVQFKISIWGEFWYGGEKFDRIEIPATVIVGEEDWISQEISFNEAPLYIIEEVTSEEDRYNSPMIGYNTRLHNSNEDQLSALDSRNDIVIIK